jgi:hypothetical protein
MVAPYLTPSDFDRRRLRATRGQLDHRWHHVSSILSAGLGRSLREVSADAEYLAAGVWTGIRGSAVERIDRNRGTAAVAPLLHLPNALYAWLGYQEVWDLETGRAPYVFRQTSLTVHLGEVGDPIKPQLLRLEWPGLKDWDRSGIGFQSFGAGHPHWQIDFFESIHEQTTSALFEPDIADKIETFGAEAITPTLSDRIRSLTFERMHLASAAPWWSSKPADFGAHHLNAPADEGELSRWLAGSINYLKQEIARCVVRS